MKDFKNLERLIGACCWKTFPTERRKTWCVVDPVERPVEILLVVEQKDFFADERLFMKFTSIEIRKTFWLLLERLICFRKTIYSQKDLFSLHERLIFKTKNLTNEKKLIERLGFLMWGERLVLSDKKLERLSCSSHHFLKRKTIWVGIKGWLLFYTIIIERLHLKDMIR